MITFQEELARIDLGNPQHFRNLTLFPLIRTDTVADAGPDYVLLDDALEARTARITEVGDGGSVPELRFENLAERPVLIVDGQELVGAKQNRVVNVTVLAPAKCTIVIPVSCVEAGRWSSVSSVFSCSDHFMYPGIRAGRTAQVSGSMRRGGWRNSDQGAVWGDIDKKAASLGARSATGAMSAIFERHALNITDFVKAFNSVPGEVGVIFAMAGLVVGFDLFDHHETLRKLFPKLVRSYALDALDIIPKSTVPPSHEAAMGILSDVCEARSFAEPAIGIGKDVRYAGTDVVGAALWAQDRYIHVCGFRMEDESQKEVDSRITALGSRRHTF